MRRSQRHVPRIPLLKGDEGRPGLQCPHFRAGLNIGTCRDVFAAVIDSHQCILSKDILGEYVTVARRKHFAKAAANLIDLIRTVSRNAVFVTPEPASLRLPDPKDQIYLDAALAAKADVLITGNKKHFPDSAYQDMQVVSPREFLALIGRERE